MQAPYETVEEIKAELVAIGFPADHLEALMEHKPAPKN